MSNPTPSKTLHISLWVAQVALALAFGMIGVTKLTTSEADIIQQSGELVEKYGVGLIRFIGIAEVLGALGLILPAALRIFSVLTPLAALGLAIIMGLATALHAPKGEPIVTQVFFLYLHFLWFGGDSARLRFQPFTSIHFCRWPLFGSGLLGEVISKRLSVLLGQCA